MTPCAPDPSAPRASSRWRGPALRGVVVAAASALLFGGWALWMNADHGWRAALTAGATQTFASFTTTFFIALVMEGLAATTPDPRGKFVRAFLGSILVAGPYMIALHWLAGTPDLWATLSVPFATGGAFGFAYSANLMRAARSAAAPAPLA
jgi:hypothetical protein